MGAPNRLTQLAAQSRLPAWSGLKKSSFSRSCRNTAGNPDMNLTHFIAACFFPLITAPRAADDSTGNTLRFLRQISTVRSNSLPAHQDPHAEKSKQRGLVRGRHSQTAMAPRAFFSGGGMGGACEGGGTSSNVVRLALED